MQELLGKKIITDEEATDLQWISENRELFEILRDTYVQDETSDNVKSFISKIKKLAEGKEDKLRYYEYLLEFVDNMIKSVEKKNTSNSNQSVPTATAMDALYALRKEYVDNRITSLLEELKRIEENVERIRKELELKQKDLESKQKYLESKQKEIEVTEKEYDVVQSQLEELRNLRSTLLEEKNSLERQVKGRLEQISTDFAEEKALKKQEMSRELQEELKILTSKRDELYQKINSIIKEHESKENNMQMAFESYEVEWVPITEEHDIYRLNHWSFESYFNQLIEIYCLKTNKSREDALSDFAKKTPELVELNEMFKDEFTNEKTNHTLYLKKILDCTSWDDEATRCVQKVHDLLSKVKVPSYIEKNKHVRNIDALNVYLQSLSLKIELSKALVERDALRDELESILLSEPERAIQKTK